MNSKISSSVKDQKPKLVINRVYSDQGYLINNNMRMNKMTIWTSISCEDFHK